jgi:hypothetical protein
MIADKDKEIQALELQVSELEKNANHFPQPTTASTRIIDEEEEE